MSISALFRRPLSPAHRLGYIRAFLDLLQDEPSSPDAWRATFWEWFCGMPADKRILIRSGIWLSS